MASILTPQRIERWSKIAAAAGSAAVVAENPKLAQYQPAMQAAGEAAISKALRKTADGAPEVHDAIRAEIDELLNEHTVRLGILDWLLGLLRRD